MTEAEQLGFFGAMDSATRRESLARTRLVNARKGAALLTKGDASSDVFFVLEGQLQVLLYSSSGREVSLRTLKATDMFGELAAIDGESRSASIVATEDTRLLVISRADFRRAIEGSPPAASWMLGQLTDRIRELTERVYELSALNVQARLHCELLRMAKRSADGLEIAPAPTHAELANRIGTHREAVTREMRALAAQNIIKAGRRRLQFLDIGRLQISVEAVSVQPTPTEKPGAA